jgi:hypothetical protein
MRVFTTETVSDDVKRVYDELNMHAVAKARGWVSFALADGTSDHAVYDSWASAVAAKRFNRDDYCYIELQPDGCPSYSEAHAILEYPRTLSKMGYRVPPPDSVSDGFGEITAMPSTPYDRMRMANQLVTGKKLVPDEITVSNLPLAFRRNK